MSFVEYMAHYFKMPEAVYFFLLALGVLFVLFVGLYLYSLVKAKGYKGIQRHEIIRISWHILIERYYELVFSGTSILMFVAVYYLINRFLVVDDFREIWEKYDDFALMFLIIFSCMFNSFLDRIFVRFKFLNRTEISAGRLTGMFYMMIIFFYIKFIYNDDNYDMFISYFLGLMVGRFAYFDSSVHDFLLAMKGVKKNIPLLIFTLIYTAIMCLYGFGTDYLLTGNGVLVNVLFAHIVMCLAIFVLYHIHIAELVTGKGGREPQIGENGRNVF